jgi:uncharacterized protein (TIGR02996 family)
VTDGEALLATILAQPADDGARLVYADWLQEHGQPERAGLIRKQIIAHQKRDAEATQDEESRDCAAELLLWHCVWRECFGFPWIVWMKLKEVHWVRGFLESVTCTAAAWLQHGDAIRAAHPVTRVSLTTWPTWDFNEYGAALTGRSRRDQLRGGDHGQRDIAERLLRGEWSGVSFELPP